MIPEKIIFIVGPTAVGKSECAYYLAKKREGEIISCDSMQIYKEISIASGKPPADILKTVEHYLMGQISVEEEFDVRTFNQLACDAVRKIHGKGKLPLIVGGSGLYMRILLDGIFDEAGKDPDLREKLKQRAKEEGSEILYKKLAEIDPQASSKIHPNDARRIIRALEITATAQKPISEVQKNRTGLWGKYKIFLYALNRERSALYECINNRVDKMFERGLLDEINGLAALKLSKTAEAVIGIKEVRRYLEGNFSLDEAKEIMKQNTRRFAKRQLTWFRKEKRLKWISRDHLSCQQIADKIAEEI